MKAFVFSMSNCWRSKIPLYMRFFHADIANYRLQQLFRKYRKPVWYFSLICNAGVSQFRYVVRVYSKTMWHNSLVRLAGQYCTVTLFNYVDASLITIICSCITGDYSISLNINYMTQIYLFPTYTYQDIPKC